MYKLLGDETEITNLCHPGNETAESIEMRPYLQKLLEEQRRLKCLKPRVKGDEQGERAGGEGDADEDVPRVRRPRREGTAQPTA